VLSSINLKGVGEESHEKVHSIGTIWWGRSPFSRTIEGKKVMLSEKGDIKRPSLSIIGRHGGFGSM